MAPKKVINELCRQCNEVNATMLPDGIKTGHRCLKPVPGPHPYPYKFRWSEAIFVDRNGKEYFEFPNSALGSPPADTSSSTDPRSKPTCGDLYQRLLAMCETDDDRNSFTWGFMAGNMEKVHLGACVACMFRPSPDRMKWAIHAASAIAGVYGLRVEVASYDMIVDGVLTRIDEIWAFRPKTRDRAMSWITTTPNSIAFHKRRAAACGIPPHEIDMNFHMRKNYGKPCDR